MNRNLDGMFGNFTICQIYSSKIEFGAVLKKLLIGNNENRIVNLKQYIAYSPLPLPTTWLVLNYRKATLTFYLTSFKVTNFKLPPDLSQKEYVRISLTNPLTCVSVPYGRG